jgi:DNA-binding NtrC family response regulator
MNTDPKYTPSVLIADLDEDILDLFRDNLLKYKYKLFFANKYADCINLLDLKKIDLIITDLYLGEKQKLGLFFATKAKDIDKNIQIIITAENPDSESIKEATEIDVYDYLQKPIQVPAISRASTRAIEKRLLLDERDELKHYVDEINRKLEVSNEKYKKFTEELKTGKFEVEERLSEGMSKLRKELKTLQNSGIEENGE